MAKKLQIVSKRDGFRRAGHTFSGTATLINPADLTKEQLESLKSEPLLVVTEIEVKDEKPAKESKDENASEESKPVADKATGKVK